MLQYEGNKMEIRASSLLLFFVLEASSMVTANMVKTKNVEIFTAGMLYSKIVTIHLV